MSGRVAITGASGQLGRLVAERVLAQCAPRDVILATRSPNALELAPAGAEIRRADFDEPDSLRAALVGADRMLLISATDLERRVAQHRAAIAAAEAAGVRHVIYTSGSRPAPPNPAAVAPSHYATEQALAASGLAWTVLRNSLYADYQSHEALHAIETGVLAHNRGAGRVAYVARDDCAAAAAAVLLQDGHDGAVYDITGAESSDARGARVALRRSRRQPCRTSPDRRRDIRRGARRQLDATVICVTAPSCSHRSAARSARASSTFAAMRSRSSRDGPPRTLRDVLEPRVRGAPRAGHPGFCDAVLDSASLAPARRLPRWLCATSSRWHRSCKQQRKCIPRP